MKPRGQSWVGTLLASLQYSAASHGTRRFVLHGASHEDAVEAWLFSRARFSTSVSRHWSTTHPESTLSAVWKGHRVFYRPPHPALAGTAEESVESVEVPDPIYSWTRSALEECNASLPAELRSVLPGWNAAYLAQVVRE